MRALPQLSRDFSIRALPHYTFTVVFDRPAFIQGHGFLFFIPWTEPNQRSEPQTTNTVIGTWRSAIIYEASRRLAMLAVREGI